MDISKENKNSRTKEIISTVAYIVAVVLIVFLILKLNSISTTLIIDAIIFVIFMLEHFRLHNL